MILADADSGVERSFRVSILGEAVVGKTCFMLRLIEDRFEDHYAVTIGMDFHSKVFYIGNATIKLQIWDTAGQENFRAITRSFYNKSQAVVLMFDLTSKPSFDAVRGWVSDIRTNASTMIFLVGNQLDATQEVSQLRAVTSDEALGLVKELELESYSEVSAKTGENVRETMEKVARVLWHSVEEREAPVLVTNRAKVKKKCC